MRLTSFAAGIITLALAGSPALTTIVSRAAAVPRPASSEGPALGQTRAASLKRASSRNLPNHRRLSRCKPRSSMSS